MKTQSYILFTSALLLSPTFAIEAPEDDAPPPPAVGGSTFSAPPVIQAAPSQDTAFLGVVTSEVPEILAEHLKLSAGQGILVRSLMPEGPAAKAGISANDIITRVGELAIRTPEDLSRAIANHQPSDVVSIQLIHHGEPLSLEITLAKRPQQFATTRPQAQGDLNFDQLPQDLADRIRGALQKNLGGMNLDLDAQPGALALPAPRASSSGKIQVQSGATMRMRDHSGCIEIKSSEGNKDITLRDPKGDIVWSGPWNTEQDKAAAPPEIRNRIEAMHLQDGPQANAGFQLQFPKATTPALGGP